MSACSRSTFMTLPKVMWGAVTVESACTMATTSPTSGGSSSISATGGSAVVTALGTSALPGEGRGDEKDGATAPSWRLLASVVPSSPPLLSPVGH